MDDPPLHQRLWEANLDLARECLEHPFVRGLGDGTLPPEAFGRYVAQDVFYLEAFFRAYALAAARCEGRHGDAVTFHRLMGGVLEELEMHAGHAARLGLDVDHVTPHPATRGYVDFLLGVAWHRGLGETVTAMTPCMRLYAFLGQSLAPGKVPSNSYRGWIETYSAPEMEELAATLEGMLDRFAADEPETEQLYRRAMEHELAFFDAPLEGLTSAASRNRA